MSKKLTSTLITSIVSAVVATATLPAYAADNSKWVKCYGVAKAKKNDCGTSKHSCAGLANENGDPTEWIMMPPGICNNLVGGSENTAGGGLADACKNEQTK